jgi:hypothetical protein
MGPRKLNKMSALLSMILLGSALIVGGDALAKGGVPAPAGGGGGGGAGGTAKPPIKNLTAPTPIPTLTEPFNGAAAPNTDISTVNGVKNAALVNGFDVTGFIQAETVDNSHNICTPAVLGSGAEGGTITINGITIDVPCGTIVQMPANTLTWKEFVDGGSLKLDGGAYPSFEAQVIGNNIAGAKRAALIYVSQHAANTGSGYITKIDYQTGRIEVANGSPSNGGAGNVNNNTTTVLEINDPNGRFGRAQSPDPRFSVDDENPTIIAGTGYPMCVPRLRPDAGGGDYPTQIIDGIAVPNDPECPIKNRPIANGACRLLTNAGVTLARGDITQTPLPVVPNGTTTYCSQFVMKALPGSIVWPTGRTIDVVNPLWVAGPTDPDPSKQAPLKVGDFITYSGTTMKDGSGFWLSVHTLEAGVGIYTQPSTQPAYVAMGEFGIGTADIGAAGVVATAITGVGIETTNRLSLEASTTDVKTPIDIYLVDDYPNGVVRNRWVTPWEMTGECDPALLPTAVGSSFDEKCGGNSVNGVTTPVGAVPTQGFSGGINTTWTGPQPMRDRIRAVKAPTNLLSQPGRMVRVMQRSLCSPTQPIQTGFDLAGNPVGAVTSGVDACLAAKVPVANGLIAGTYQAPVFEYIFPENLRPGDIIIPNDFWHLPFLRNGESGAQKLDPQPW